MSKSNVFYSSNRNYTEVPDEELIKMIQNDNNTYALEHLMDRYRNLVNIKVSKYYMIGAEREDIVQEGDVGQRCSYLLSIC